MPSGSSDTAQWVPRSPSFLSSLNSMEEGGEGREKQVVAVKKLARSDSKNIGAWGRSVSMRGRGHGKRWSSSTDLEIETAAAVTPTPIKGGATAAATVLGRSYSTTAAIAATVNGDVKHEQMQRQEGEGEGEQHLRRRGTGERFSRKIKEHRARFYIMRRCVAMLVCWRDTDD